MRFHKIEERIADAVKSAAFGSRHRLLSESLLLRFRSAQKFYGGDVERLPELEKYAAQMVPRLPFASCAFELETDSGGLIALCAEVSDELMLCDTFLMLPFVGWEHAGQLKVERRSTVGEVMAAQDYANIAIFAGLAAAMRVIGVLNCVNVTTEAIPAPVALNKKRARSGKLPIYTYKTLVLKTAQTRTQRLGGTHESPRIHLRRGHIKHRKTGDFWWQPCVVGDRKRGMVVKDYRADELRA